MRRKLISLSLLGALFLGALTACGETATDTGTGTETDASLPALTSEEAMPMESMMASPAASPAP